MPSEKLKQWREKLGEKCACSSWGNSCGILESMSIDGWANIRGDNGSRFGTNIDRLITYEEGLARDAESERTRPEREKQWEENARKRKELLARLTDEEKRLLNIHEYK